MKVTALAGGIGAAKLLLGLSRVVEPGAITAIVNTGDDIILHGLRISPDLDTVAYTLAGIVNPDTGWGVQGDSFECLDRLKALGAETWFRLGDRDLATHIFRTSLLTAGKSLCEATRQICRRLGVQTRILPMCEGFHPTLLETDRGRLHLQEYLVRDRCQPMIERVVYSSIDQATPAAGVASAIGEADAIFICPSNPFISIGPILAVPGFRQMLVDAPAPVAAISPIVGGRAIKGPAARMLADLGHEVSALGVARMYAGVADHFVLDKSDRHLKDAVESLGVKAVVLDTVMRSLEDKVRLAGQLMGIL